MVIKNNITEYWDKQAKSMIDWSKKYKKILNWNAPYSDWFVDGKLNASFNCIDRWINKGYGDKVAFYFESENSKPEKITYHQLLKETSKLANGLKSLGIKKGDIVAIYMPMTLEAIYSMLACVRIGAVHTVIFGGIAPKSIKSRLDDSKPKLIITADFGHRRGKIIKYLEKINQTLQMGCPYIEKIIVLNRSLEFSALKKNEISYHELVANQSNYCQPEEMDSEDLMFILYTSGTTGKPKGIIHTTGGYMVGVCSTFKQVFDYQIESDIYFCTADVGWITGHSYVVYGPLANGATQVIYEGTPDYPDKSQFWRLCRKYKVTIFYTAPTAIRLFMTWGEEQIKKFDISSIRLLGSIGEPLNPEAWHWYKKNIGLNKSLIMDTWFQTETGSFVISPTPKDEKFKPGSVSKPLDGYEVKILDEKGNEVNKGLLAITHPFPSMLRGIYNDHKRFVNTYWSKWKDNFYFTGDGAIKDENGFIQVTGRVDDILNISGHMIGSAEVENALVDHEYISESAVIGISDDISGECAIAFVILKDKYKYLKNDNVLKSEIINFVGSKIGSYAKPKKIIFCPNLPKTRSGKIMRRVLKSLILKKSDIGDISTLENNESLTKILEEIK